MPLKHTTETLLVFLLGAVTTLTGIMASTLPSLPAGLMAWAIVFVAACLYPLFLGGLLRRNRADMTFRRLHWAPAALLLIWLALQGAAQYVPALGTVARWFTWGWTLPAVATVFFLLIFFCLSVIRRWLTRLLLLLAAFVPFVFGGVGAEMFQWNPQLTATVWQGDWWKAGGDTVDGMLARGDDEEQHDDEDKEGNGDSSDMSDKNLAMSGDPKEERYRENLRAMEARKNRVEKRLAERQEQEAEIAEEMAEKQEEMAEQSVEGTDDHTDLSFFARMMKRREDHKNNKAADAVAMVDDKQDDGHEEHRDDEAEHSDHQMQTESEKAAEAAASQQAYLERVMERRKEFGRLDKEADDADVAAVVSEPEVPVAPTTDGAVTTGREVAPTVTKVAALPNSGFGWAAIVVALLAGYCASVQRKTSLRLLSR